MTIWKFGLQLNYYTRKNFNARLLKEYESYIHLDTIHARNLKFGIYLPCMTSHKRDVVMLKILYFGHFMGKNVPKNNGHIGFLVFWP